MEAEKCISGFKGKLAISETNSTTAGNFPEIRRRPSPPAPHPAPSSPIRDAIQFLTQLNLPNSKQFVLIKVQALKAGNRVEIQRELERGFGLYSIAYAWTTLSRPSPLFCPIAKIRLNKPFAWTQDQWNHPSHWISIVEFLISAIWLFDYISNLWLLGMIVEKSKSRNTKLIRKKKWKIKL